MLNLYNGVRDITPVNNNYAFLMNLKDYSGLMSVGYISSSGELLKVQTINKDNNVDINNDFIHIEYDNDLLYVFYERRSRKIVIESFDNLGIVNESIINGSSGCYGTIFQIDENSKSVYVRSEYKYEISNQYGYRYNFIDLDSNMGVKKKKVVNLGSYYPMGITSINGNIFFFIDDRKLYYYSGETRGINPIYKFTEDIVELKRKGDNLLVLLKDYLYMVNNKGEVVKEFKLQNKESGYRAVAIVNSNKRGIMVQFRSGKDNLFRSFSINGNQTGEFKVKRADLYGDCFYNYEGLINKIIYSTTEGLYIKSL